MLMVLISGDFIVSHGGVVGEGGQEDGGLLEVVFVDVFEHVHVGVSGADVVVDVALDGVEAGDAGADEADVVGAADALDEVFAGVHIEEGFEPGVEDFLSGFVVFHVEAVDGSAAGIGVEIDREIIAGGLVGVAGEVGAGIVVGAEQALFFAVPDAQADGAAGFDADGLEDSHRLHRAGDGVGIVGGAVGRVPGIQVGAEHDDFILENGIDAGDFADDIIAIRIVGVVLDLDVGADFDFESMLDYPGHHIVVFGGQDDGGNGVVAAIASEDADGAVNVLAGAEDDAGFFILEQGGQLA